MKERGESTYRNAEETMAANILGITSPTNTIKNEEEEEIDRNYIQKLHLIEDLHPSSSQLPIFEIGRNSRGAKTPTNLKRMLNEDTENRVFEPLITLTSKDQDWPPLVQSLPETSIKSCDTLYPNMLDTHPSTIQNESVLPTKQHMTMVSARPQSARKGPPKIHSIVVNNEKAPPKPIATSLDMTSSLMSGGENEKEVSCTRQPSIFLDHKTLKDDESDALHVVAASVDHGKLTQSNAKLRGVLENIVEIESPEEQDLILGASNEVAEFEQEEIQKLQKLVQVLCQATNPLGKIMDYLQVGRRMRKS